MPAPMNGKLVPFSLQLDVWEYSAAVPPARLLLHDPPPRAVGEPTAPAQVMLALHRWVIREYQSDS